MENDNCDCVGEDDAVTDDDDDDDDYDDDDDNGDELEFMKAALDHNNSWRSHAVDGTGCRVGGGWWW